MISPNDTISKFPHSAMYRRNTIHWYSDGSRGFVEYRYKVEVIGKTEKSYKIKFNNRESWVRKDKIQFIYLTDGDYCELRDRRIPPLGCKTCFEKCALRMTNMPYSYK